MALLATINLRVRSCPMTAATTAVKGSASDDFPADDALVQVEHEFDAPTRSAAFVGGNAVIAQVRDVESRREVKVQLLRGQEMFRRVGPNNIR